MNMNDTTLAPGTTPAVWSDRDAFELACRQAKVYASSTIVPEIYRDNLANCFIAMNMAKRIGADIMQTMQSLHIIYGKPGWSAQFLIATFNQCGKYSALRYEWTGEKGTPEWGCRAWAVEKATRERIEGPWVTLKLVRDEGWFDRKDKQGNFVSKWRTMPELMFHYRAAAFLVRTHAPELAMGLQTAEELSDSIIDITPQTEAASPAIPSAISAAKEAIRKAMPEIDVTTGEILSPADAASTAQPPQIGPESTQTWSGDLLPPEPPVEAPEASAPIDVKRQASEQQRRAILAAAKTRGLEPAAVDHLIADTTGGFVLATLPQQLVNAVLSAIAKTPKP
jgi:hypothetical protein